MSIQTFLNTKCCIATSNINEEEIYMLFFEYNNNQVYHAFDKINNSSFKLTKKNNKKFYFNFKSEAVIEYSQEDLALIKESILNHFINVYIICIDNETKDVFLSYYNDEQVNIENKKTSIGGILINNPEGIQEILNNTEEQKLANFQIAMIENGKIIYITIYHLYLNSINHFN